MESPAEAPGLEVRDVEDGIRVVELARPDRLNALDAATAGALHAALDRTALDPTCRVVILTGQGRGFCSGLDLHGFGVAPGSDPEDGLQSAFTGQRLLSSLILHLQEIPQPVIAAVNGPAAGTGLALVLGCDVRLAARSASFNTAFIKLGVSNCDMGLSWLLPRLVGVARAQELLLTGRRVDAEEAERIGLVAGLYEDEELMPAALGIARTIAGYPGFAVAQTKEAMWAMLEIPHLRTAIALENRQQIMLTTSGGFRAASERFAEGGQGGEPR